jgi:hypothetical protein
MPAQHRTAVCGTGLTCLPTPPWRTTGFGRANQRSRTAHPCVSLVPLCLQPAVAGAQSASVWWTAAVNSSSRQQAAGSREEGEGEEGTHQATKGGEGGCGGMVSVRAAPATNGQACTQASSWGTGVAQAHAQACRTTKQEGHTNKGTGGQWRTNGEADACDASATCYCRPSTGPLPATLLPTSASRWSGPLRGHCGSRHLFLSTCAHG